jgi:glycosyltransferase involved in cell wall biosynthesis
MKISVITVCFNSEKTIEDTIKSVLSQSYKNIEYIVIDGGSTDGTLPIIEKYRSFIDCFVSEPDDGLYDAMNKGINNSTGDVIGILNSDDVFFNDMTIEKVAENIVGFDAVYSDVAFYNDNDFKKIVRYYSSDNFSVSSLSRGVMPAHPSLYVKKERYVQVGLYDKTFKIAADFDMIVRLFSLFDFKATYIQGISVKMRMGGVSTSGFSSNILLNKEILASCRSHGIRTNWFKVLSKYPRKILGYFVKS